MSYLLDTNVVSELRKGNRQDPSVAEWFSGAGEDDVFLSVLVVGEIRNGIERVSRRDRAAATALEGWLDGLVTLHAKRILPVDLRVAEEWGRLASRRSLPVVDGLMAATALVHGLTLVTRNEKDVSGTGATVLNPFTKAKRGARQG